jgi:hypothetical protein
VGIERCPDAETRDVNVFLLATVVEAEDAQLIVCAELEVPGRVPGRFHDDLGPGSVEVGAGPEVDARPQSCARRHEERDLKVSEVVPADRNLELATDRERLDHVLVKVLRLDPAAATGLRVPLHPQRVRPRFEHAVRVAVGREGERARVHASQ